jgi:catechol 2,3-dioxygenase
LGCGLKQEDAPWAGLHPATRVGHGIGAPPPPPNATGLRYFTIVVPDEAELERVTQRIQQAGIALETTPAGVLVRDPAQNGILLARNN